jgi:hypothetical protein
VHVSTAWIGAGPGGGAPAAAVGRLPQRLDVPVGELRGYGERGQTRPDHLREIVAYCGWRAMDSIERKELDEFLFARAMEHDSPTLLFRLACEYLISSRMVRPGAVLILERVAGPRARAGEETWAQTAAFRDRLTKEQVPLPERDVSSRNRLCWRWPRRQRRGWSPRPSSRTTARPRC